MNTNKTDSIADQRLGSKKAVMPAARKEWLVRISEIPAQGLDFSFSSKGKALDSYLEDLLGESPEYDCKIKVTSNDKMAVVQGKFLGKLPLDCSRCAESFLAGFNKETTIAFYRSEADHVKALGDDLVDIQGSFDLEFLDSNEINVAEVIHEQIALEIPFQPLCKENCLGLCHQCGANFNLEKCQCSSKPDGFSPFSALKHFKT